MLRREDREEEEQERERPGREEVHEKREEREGEERASSLWLVYILWPSAETRYMSWSWAREEDT